MQIAPLARVGLLIGFALTTSATLTAQTSLSSPGRHSASGKNSTLSNSNAPIDNESLGDKIRNNPGLELTEDASTDQLKSERASDNSQSDPDESEASARIRASTEHLRRLRKPIQQIQLRTNIADLPTPASKSESIVADAAPVFVSALGYPLPGPDRYTVCQTHRPLYFEQRNLERCGNGYGILQNAVSGATFLANTIVLPYKMGKQRPDCEVCAGGDCKSCQSYPCGADLLPVDAHGVTMELAAIAGFTFLFL